MFFSVVTCPRPTEANLIPTPNQVNYDFNTSVSIDCILGYNLTYGDATRTCLHTKQWDGIPPNCTGTYYVNYGLYIGLPCQNIPINIRSYVYSTEENETWTELYVYVAPSLQIHLYLRYIVYVYMNLTRM